MTESRRLEDRIKLPVIMRPDDKGIYQEGYFVPKHLAVEMFHFLDFMYYAKNYLFNNRSSTRFDKMIESIMEIYGHA